DDQQAAMSAGIDLHLHLAIAWAVMGIVSVLAGTLWTLVGGGGFGVVLVGLRVFPIVIIGGVVGIAAPAARAARGAVLESRSRRATSIRCSAAASAPSRPISCSWRRCSCDRTDCSGAPTLDASNSPCPPRRAARIPDSGRRCRGTRATPSRLGPGSTAGRRA